jgi:hypothetical protein
MNTMEDRLRAALEETAEEITPYSVPPLRLNRARRRGLPGFGEHRRWAAWLAPLAAAAAVAAVIIASAAVSGTIGGGQQPTVATGTAGLPRYYVALRFSSHNICCQPSPPLPKTYAVVVSTATGAVLASIPPPGPDDTFVGVTGAADDRTFVLGVQQYGSNSPTRFYLLRITPLRPSPLRTIAPTGSPKLLRTIAPTGSPSPYIPTGSPSPYTPTGSPSPYIPTGSPSPHTPTGSPSPFSSPSPSASLSPVTSATPSGSTEPFGSSGPGGSFRPALLLARLSPLHIPPDQAELTGFALSPQGTSLAVLDDVGLHVVNLATGAQRNWDHPRCFLWSPLGDTTTDAKLSWTTDGRRLATVCLPDVRLLNTTAPGRNPVKDSQLLVRGPVVGRFLQVLLTRDARTVVGVLVVSHPLPPAANSPIQELAEFSARTGKLLRVLNRLPVLDFAGFERVLWASPSGHSLLVGNTVPYRSRHRDFFLLNDAGVLTGHQFTPLRHWSIDTLAAAW